MPSHTVAVELADGRRLEAVSEGDEHGRLLVFHHGSPGAAVPFPSLHRAAFEREVHVVTPSRPGFGDSTRYEGRRVADAAGDAAALADHFDAERFLTIGWSGGGPHAIACAALLPERVAAAATIAGVAPFDAAGLDWTAGMGEGNQVEYPLAAADPVALLEWQRPHVDEMSHIAPEEIVAAMRSLISDVDEESISGELGDVMADSFHRAFANGPWGWYDDDLAFVAPWGFDLDSITVPVSVWQGRHDLMVPIAHGEWLAAHVASARPRLRPQHGHLSLAVGSIGEILDDLLEAGA